MCYIGMTMRRYLITPAGDIVSIFDSQDIKERVKSVAARSIYATALPKIKGNSYVRRQETPPELITRNKKIAEMILSGNTLQATADNFGITRERVRQISRKINGRGALAIRAENRPLAIPRPKKYCIRCGTEITSRAFKFCGMKCRQVNHSIVRDKTVMFKCANCGVFFNPYRTQKYQKKRQSRYFCGIKCYANSPWHKIVIQEGKKKVVEARRLKCALALGVSAKSILSVGEICKKYGKHKSRVHYLILRGDLIPLTQGKPSNLFLQSSIEETLGWRPVL